jgi:hypothetical protein
MDKIISTTKNVLYSDLLKRQLDAVDSKIVYQKQAIELAEKERHDATRALEKEVERIDKPLAEKVSRLESKLDRLEQKSEDIERQYKRASSDERFAAATKTGTLSIELAEAFLIHSGLNMYDARVMPRGRSSYGDFDGNRILGSLTQNGLTTLAEIRYNYSRYWLFKGAKPVAVWIRKKPQGFTWGDREPVYAYLNGKESDNRYLTLSQFKASAKDSVSLPRSVILNAVEKTHKVERGVSDY